MTIKQQSKQGDGTRRGLGCIQLNHLFIRRHITRIFVFMLMVLTIGLATKNLFAQNYGGDSSLNYFRNEIRDAMFNSDQQKAEQLLNEAQLKFGDHPTISALKKEFDLNFEIETDTTSIELQILLDQIAALKLKMDKQQSGYDNQLVAVRKTVQEIFDF